MKDLIHVFKTCLRDALDKASYGILPIPMKTAADDAHLDATVGWLLRAAENGSGGVSSHYSPLQGGWMPPFPETTGYIIPTLYDYAAWAGRPEIGDVAQRLTDWLVDVQLPSGACMQGRYDARRGPNPPIIFNTGQNIFGFLRAFEETGEHTYLNAAVRAGDFLVESTGADGTWVRALHHGLPHTYNARTAWALLELHERTRRAPYFETAIRNLDWVVEQQETNGWFRNANFKPGEWPNTHGIAYTTRGLVESFRLTYEERYLAAARVTAEKVRRLFEIRKSLNTFWDHDWRNHGKYFDRMSGRYACVTGNIQFALIWMRIYEITGEATWVSSAFKVIDQVKVRQDVLSDHPGSRGGVPGAFPFYGSYSVLKYPNWAAKFFADALLLKINLSNDTRLARNNIHPIQQTHAHYDSAPIPSSRKEFVEA